MLHSVRVTSTGILLVAAMCVAAPAFAQGPAVPAAPAAAGTEAAQDPQAALRAQIELLRQQLEALQQKVAALEAAGGPRPAAPAPAPPPTAAEVPAGAAGAGGPAGALPVYGSTSALSKIFNPDMAVIGNFVGAAGKNTIAPIPALHLNEAEMSFQAIVDPYARADFFLSASPEGLSIEEGFITFPTLPGGLLMKVGKMKAQFGKVNTMHSHVLPWVDVPLAQTNLLGGEEGLNDSGISVSKLILNPILFLEATGEIYNGDNSLFKSYKRSDLGYVGRLRGYRDVTEGTNLDLGTSIAYGHNDAGPDSTTRLFGVDATIRYRPLRRAIYKRFIGRTELFWSRRQQPAGDAKAFGAYVSGDYQFAQRWFAGARYDYSERAIDASLKDKAGSFLVTYWPSEFSQIRGQFRRTIYAEGPVANELLFQFLFSIGAHGAHVF
ncbi:MAG TPA: TonB-dependent receptor [Vicinamibacterales bacterium]